MLLSNVLWNEWLDLVMLQLLSMMAQSSEFGQMAIREEELPELDALARDACHFDIKGGPENKHGKVNILLQASAAMRLLDACCIYDYRPSVSACCWADVAPEVQSSAACLPCLWRSAVPSIWVSINAAMQTQGIALQASGCCACQPMSQTAAVSSPLPDSMVMPVASPPVL